MNRILLILVFIFSFVFSFGQPIVPRSGGSLTVGDSNSFIGNSFRVPLFFDTSRANTNRPSLDSMGKIIFTRDVNWFWGRVYIPGTSSHKWVPFANPSTNLNVNCGNSIGSHIVTWDSLLVFDVTGGPYVLCCDGIPRATLPTTITLQPGDSLNPRFDAIILDTNGVNVIQGTPSENPVFPQIDSCQILLTYVNVLTGQMVPSGITQTVIYDEFVQGEWDSLRRSLVTVDSLNPNFPIHGTVAAYVHGYTTGNFFEFHTDTAVDLNNYSALKFYIRDSSAVRVSITWYLDNQPQTPAVLAPVQTFNLNNYQVIVMPISNWRFTQNSTLANTIRFTITPVNASDAKGLFIDWIQLQGGVLITNTSTTGLQSFSASGIDAVATQVLNPNGPNTTLVLSKPLQPPYTVYANDSSGNAPFRPTAVNLGTPMITGLLDPIHIQPSTVDGDLLFTENIGGTLTTVWDGGGTDTTFVKNWLRRYTDPNSFNDTLVFGSREPDSAVLSFETYVSLNSFLFHIQQTGLGDYLTLDPVNFQAILQTNQGTAISGFSARADLVGTAVYFSIVADEGASHPTSIVGDDINQVIEISTDTIQLHSTLSGANAGYQWTLADPLSGSGYWGPAGGAASETLQQVFNTEVGGSVLTKIDSIQASTFDIVIFSSGSLGLSSINTNTGGVSIQGSATGLLGIGVSGAASGTAGEAGNFSSTGDNGIGVIAEADGVAGIPISSGLTPVDNSTVLTNLQLVRSAQSNPTNGIGQSIDFVNLVGVASNVYTMNQIISKITDVTEATRTSQMIFTGVNNATTNTIYRADGRGNTEIGDVGALFNQVKITIDDLGKNIYLDARGTGNVIAGDVFGVGNATYFGVADGTKEIQLHSDHVQFLPITATAASAITPAEGMMLFVSNTNGTFTSIGFWGYQNGAWHAF